MGLERDVIPEAGYSSTSASPAVTSADDDIAVLVDCEMEMSVDSCVTRDPLVIEHHQ